MDWSSCLSDTERRFVFVVLGSLASCTGLALDNVVHQFCVETTVPEIRMFSGVQIMMQVHSFDYIQSTECRFYRENVHVEIYAHLLRELEPNGVGFGPVLDTVTLFPDSKEKIEWCSRYFDRDQHSFSTRLIMHAVVEGLFTSSALAAVLWFQTLGLLPGLCHAARLISRDKQLFVDFACRVHDLLSEQVPRNTVNTIISEAVSLEQACFAGTRAPSTLPEFALILGRSRS